MSWIHRLRASFRKSKLEDRLDDELQFHIEMRVQEFIAAGMTPEEARCRTRRLFGNQTLLKERTREMDTIGWIERSLEDLRYGLRMLRKQPGFTAAAITCLALGIGANTAIFSVMNAVMIRSLPVKDPGRLVLLRYTIKKAVPVQVRRTSSGYGSTSLPYAAFEELHSHASVLSHVFAFVPLGFNNQSVTVKTAGQPSLAAGEMVTGDYFSGLGVSMILGRPIVESDEKPEAPHVAVLRYGYWLRQFGGEASAVGRRIAINGVPVTIAGVAPPEFYGMNATLAPDLWIPMRDEPAFKPWGVQSSASQSLFADKGWWRVMIMGRLKPGVSEQQARTELDVLFQRSITQGLNPAPKPEELPNLELAPGRRGLDFLRQRFAEPLYILMAGVGMVLLIACANVSTLLVARAAARRREISLRMAIGASRARIVRQLLTESILLALGGGALGLLLANWGSRAIALLLSGGQALSLDAGADARVLAFCAAASVLTALLFGLLPALHATRVELATALKESSGTSSRRFGLGRLLVTGQVAFTLVLLVGAGLFVRTLQNLRHQDLGFNRRNLLLFALEPQGAGSAGARIAAIYEQVLRQIQALPGVRSATASEMALLSGVFNNSVIATDGPKVAPLPYGVYWNSVGPAFFETMSIPVVLGRGIEWRDLGSSHHVAVISEALARHHFPNENPLGRHFSFGDTVDSKDNYEVVGVARNAKYSQLREEFPGTAYVPYTDADPPARMYFEVRTEGDPARWIPAVRRVVEGIDAGLPLMNLKTQSEQMEEALASEQMFAGLSSVFSALALVLVSIGVYGTLAYAVARRTSEVGIRMALGARRRAVVWMILRESLMLIAMGAAAGLPAAFALTRFVASQLYGVKPNDAPTMAATVAVLALAGAAAGYLPARRASRVDPMVALRYE